MLAADTVVALGRRLLGKPADAAEAAAFLAPALRPPPPRGHRRRAPPRRRAAGAARSRPPCASSRLDAGEIAAYLATGEWQGKAGGYAIQGRAGGFIPWIGGSYSNVVGLPLTETLGLLAAAGRRAARP